MRDVEERRHNLYFKRTLCIHHGMVLEDTYDSLTAEERDKRSRGVPRLVRRKPMLQFTLFALFIPRLWYMKHRKLGDEHASALFFHD